MLRVELVGGEALVARFKTLSDRLRAELRAAVMKATIDLQSVVKNDKLSGQVLHVRTGRLRSSISQKVEDTTTGVTGIVGTNVEYAARHEYGFQGTETVGAHTRTITQAFGHPIDPKVVSVRSFSRKVNVPERSFLRSSLQDQRDKIRQDLQDAVARAISK